MNSRPDESAGDHKATQQDVAPLIARHGIRRVLHHRTHDIGRQGSGRGHDGIDDRQHGGALRQRGELAHDHRDHDIEGAADSGAEDQERDLQFRGGHVADKRQRTSADDNRAAGEKAAAQPAGHAFRLQLLGKVSPDEKHHRADEPGQGAEIGAGFLAETEASHQVSRKPRKAEREPPIDRETAATNGKDGRAGQQEAVGYALTRGAALAHRRIDQRPLAPEDEPQDDPKQASDAQCAKCPMPRIVLHDQRQQGYGHDDADRGTLRDNGGRQSAPMVRKPLVYGMRSNRTGRPFARAKRDAAGDNHFEAYRANHRKLHDRPDDSHDQKHGPRRGAVRLEADQDGRESEQEKERRPDQPELPWRQTQFVRHGRANDIQYDLVGEVDQHEEKEKGGDAPGALERPLLRRHLSLLPAIRVPDLEVIKTGHDANEKGAPTDRGALKLQRSGYLMNGHLPSFIGR